MTRRFMEDPEAAGNGDVVQPDRYTVEVVDARALEDKDFVWLDLKIIGGPDNNKVVSCSLNMPDDDSSRGAKWFFAKKVRGMLPYLKPVWAMPDEDQAAGLAEAVLNKRFDAHLSIQKDGQYAGTQQLDETFEITDVAPPTLQSVDAEADVSANGEPVAAGANVDPPF
jgi:hypothetical protein